MNNLGVKNIQLKGFSPVPWNSVFNRFLLEKKYDKNTRKGFFLLVPTTLLLMFC